MPLASTAGATRTAPTSRCCWCAACSATRRWPPGCASSVNPFTSQRFCRPGRGRSRSFAICALVGCEYEWGGQAAFWGPIARVSDDECDALVTGGEDAPADPRWTPAERTLIEAVDELERTGSWSEATWTALGRDLDDEQRIELLTAVGWYRTICTLCNALALPVEGWMRRWPG